MRGHQTSYTVPGSVADPEKSPQSGVGTPGGPNVENGPSPVPACGEPMRIKPHRTVVLTAEKYNLSMTHKVTPAVWVRPLAFHSG